MDEELLDLFDDDADFDEFGDITDDDIESVGYVVDDDLSELIGALR